MNITENVANALSCRFILFYFTLFYFILLIYFDFLYAQFVCVCSTEERFFFYYYCKNDFDFDFFSLTSKYFN